MKKEKIEKATWTVEEAAQRLGIGRVTAYKLARTGEFPGILRLGHRFIISRCMLEDYLAGRTEGAKVNKDS